MLLELEPVLTRHFVLEDVNRRVGELDSPAAPGANQVIMMDTPPDILIVGPTGLLARPDLGLLDYPGFKQKGKVAVNGWEGDLAAFIS